MSKPEVPIDLSAYKKDDFEQMTWSEYANILENLYKKVSKYVEDNKIKINAVVPILRGGAFPGAYLAFKLHLLRIIPIQLKYFFEGGDLNKIKLEMLLPFPKDVKLPKDPTFLLVECNCCFGLTSETAAKHLKERYQKCKIIFAADTMDYSYQKLKYMDAIFCGDFTNDTKTLSKEECKKKGVSYELRYLPWENLEEEYTTVQAKQFEYRDLEDVKRNL